VAKHAQHPKSLSKTLITAALEKALADVLRDA